MWRSVVAISLGASLGALLRWWLGARLNALFPSLPPGTLVANLAGAYVIGAGIAFFAAYTALSPEWRLLVITGFCGSLTTFSTFSAELVALLQQSRPAWEWLLEQANRLGIRGGSAFKAMAGFGRHHVLHESRFFELAGALPVEVEFIVTEDEAEQLLALVRNERPRVFFARIPAPFGSAP
jgi:CrcB protein